MDYVVPIFNASAFNCPHCGVYASQEWQQLTLTPNSVNMAVCLLCKKMTLWVSGQLIYPMLGSAPAPHSFMPKEVYEYYDKARSISLLAPAAAAAYLREAMRRLFMHLGAKGDNNNNDIEYIVERSLASRHFFASFSQAKVGGPKGIKPLVIDTGDDETMVALLFYLVNKLVDEAIANPATLAEFYAKLSDPKNEPKGPVIDADFFARD
ncbi:MAG: hypothetical protein FWE37_01840 [Spirochaetaceae bacterium]|nr:hypothetical protein [Spirochaetaceae bacterium]